MYRSIVKILSILFMIIFFKPCFAFGVNSAYLICIDGEVLKLDLDNNNVVANYKLLGVDSVIPNKNCIVINRKHNVLFVAHGDTDVKVDVFNLSNLQLITTIPGIITDSVLDIFANENLDNFFINWYNKENNLSYMTAYRYDGYNKVFEKEDFQVVSPNATLSVDGTKFYNPFSGQRNIYIYSTDTFNLLDVVNIDNAFSENVFGYDIDDCFDGNLLIVENYKKSADENSVYSIHVYSINTKLNSKIINTGMVGSSYFVSNSNEIIFDQLSYGGISSNAITEVHNVGKIYIYNIELNKVVGDIPYATKGYSSVAAIGENTDRLYLFSNTDDSKILVSLDIKNYKSISTITIPYNSLILKLL